MTYKIPSFILFQKEFYMSNGNFYLISYDTSDDEFRNQIFTFISELEKIKLSESSYIVMCTQEQITILQNKIQDNEKYSIIQLLKIKLIQSEPISFYYELKSFLSEINYTKFKEFIDKNLTS